MSGKTTSPFTPAARCGSSPAAFVCRVCKLRLNSAAEVEAAGIDRQEVDGADPAKYTLPADLSSFDQWYRIATEPRVPLRTRPVILAHRRPIGWGDCTQIPVMSTGADRWINWTTTGCVALLALNAGTVFYLDMHTLVALHGQPGWVAALTPLSVGGMIVAASTTLLADSRSGRKGGALPWALLVAGSVASLAANVVVDEPTVIGRVIAAWPSFALTASYELPPVRYAAQPVCRRTDVQADRKVPIAPRPRRAAATDEPGPVLTLVDTRPRPTRPCPARLGPRCSAAGVAMGAGAAWR
jgi:hypothetical protein